MDFNFIYLHFLLSRINNFLLYLILTQYIKDSSRLWNILLQTTAYLIFGLINATVTVVLDFNKSTSSLKNESRGPIH